MNGLRQTLRLAPLLAALFAGGCASLPPCPPPAGGPPPLPAAELDSVLFLIGDAGEPSPRGEPILGALRIAVGEAIAAAGGERVAVVFLGDNVYPDGLVAPADPAYKNLARRLDAQLGVLAQPGSPRGFFVPGNHDWGGNAADGAARLARQELYLARKSGGRALLLPPGGCPGPSLVELGERLRLLLVDTQWWLRRDRNAAGAGGCAPGERAGVLAALETAIGPPGERRVVVAGHHPLASGGPHGGRGFPAAFGFDRQNLSHRSYRALKTAFERVFRRAPPLLYAAGHDHVLQVLRGDGYPFELVSGAGSPTRLMGVGALPQTLACRQGAGFARLEIARDGRARLALLVAGADGAPREIWSALLAPAAP